MALIQWAQPILANRERQAQQVIQGEAEQKRAEKEERRSRYDARGSGIGRLLLSRVLGHCMLLQMLEATHQRYDN